MTTTDTPAPPAPNYASDRYAALTVLERIVEVHLPDDVRIGVSITAHCDINVQPFTDDPEVGEQIAASLGLGLVETSDPGQGHLHHAWSGLYSGQQVRVAVLQPYPLGHVVADPEQA